MDVLENQIDYIKEDTDDPITYKRELLSRAVPVTQCSPSSRLQGGSERPKGMNIASLL